MDGNNRRCLPDGRKEIRSPEEIEDVKKNPCQSEEGALAWDRQLCLGQWQWRRRGWRQLQKIQPGRMESRRTSETPPGTLLGNVASGSATMSLWLRNRKVRSQVSGIDRSRFSGRIVREIRRGGKRASDRAKERVYSFRVRFG